MEFRGAYVGGRFQRPAGSIEWKRQNPCNFSETLLEWAESPTLTLEAIELGRQASRVWARTELSDRIKKIESLQSIFQQREKEIESIIVKEAGKARWESRIEAKALSGKISSTLKTALPMIQKLEETGRIPGKQSFRFVPRGLCAVIGPFNFPLHLPNGQIIPALLAGNSVIFKPSEFTVGCASLYAECFDAAGFPPGVFQMLPGGAETGRALVENPQVDAVLFTGSYVNGRRITDSVFKTRPDLSTLVALEMGGKNACIIFEDAGFEKALAETLLSAFVTTGQRCSCASRVFVEESIFETFKTQLRDRARALTAGDPSDESTFMGPLIHAAARDKFFEAVGRARKDGFSEVLETKGLSEQSSFVSPSIFGSSDPARDLSKSLFQEEVFGPTTLLLHFRSKKLCQASRRATCGAHQLEPWNGRGQWRAPFWGNETKWEQLARWNPGLSFLCTNSEPTGSWPGL